MISGATEPLFSQQGYLRAAPEGIGVEEAWLNRADGSGITLIDIERGWNLGHEDLPANIPLLGGVMRPESIYHGTGVLGIIAAIDNNSKGIVGIAPRATIMVLSDHLSGLTGVNPALELDALQQETADRVSEASTQLSLGDVLLIEATYGGVPAEIDSRISDSIREATRRGIIVIEAAGDDGENLDEFRDAFGNRIFNRTEPGEFVDTGAIVVGACSSVHPHVRWADSHGSTSFGTRIDCCAWGENIVTTGSRLRPNVIDAYYDGTDIGFEFFGGTSGAAAIIAGVCLLIQSLRNSPFLVPIDRSSGRIDGIQMRRILRRLENGTDTLFGIDDGLGRQPDFAKILLNEFTALPIL